MAIRLRCRSLHSAGTSLVLAALLAATDVHAQGTKLNTPLPRSRFRTVQQMQVTPDGLQVVYFDSGLFSVPLKGGEATALTPPILRPIWGFRVTSDSTRAVYVDTNVLFVVPLDGSRGPTAFAERVGQFLELTPDARHAVFTAVTPSGVMGLASASLDKHAPPAVLDSSGLEILEGFRFSSDSRHVVYRAREPGREARLFAARVDGTTGPRALGSPDPLAGTKTDFRVSTDGSKVVFIQAAAGFELFAASLEDGVTVKLNATLSSRGNVRGFDLAPDGEHVYYSAELEGRTRAEVYRTTLTGASPTRITPDLSQGSVSKLALTADGTRIVYLADQDTRGVVELYVVSSDGGGIPRRLNGPMVQGGDVLDFFLSPDGTRVVYRADQDVDRQEFLYGASLGRASDPVRMARSPDDYLLPQLRFSLDGSRLFFVTFDLVERYYVLHAARLDGSQPERVLATDIRNYPGPAIQLVPRSTDVIFRADLEREFEYELFRMTLDGGETARLSRSPLSGEVLGRVEDFRVTAGADWAVYMTASTYDYYGEEIVDLPGKVEAVSLRGDRHVVPLYSEATSGTEGLYPYVLEKSPDGRWVVIHAIADSEDREQLFAAPVDGSRATIPISQATSYLMPWGFGADNRVVYTGYALGSSEDPRLFTTSIDGSAAPIDLTVSLASDEDPDRDVGLVRIDRPGTKVVFSFSRDQQSYELYVGEIDGSEPPVLLSSTLAIGRFHSFEVSPDGRFVVLSSATPGGRDYQTYSVPIDGSAPPTRLNPDLPTSIVATQLRDGISPDGSRVLLYIGSSSPRAYDLYTVPITGGPLVRLNAPLVPGGSVLEAKFSPGGERVLYLADQERDEVIELFSAPADGSASPVKLNQTLVEGGDVDTGPYADFQFADGGTRVVYRADAVLDERYELWSTPITSSRPVRLNQTLPDGADVLPVFRISPDGKSVLFQADSERPDVFELFVSATDRIKTAARVNGTLPFGGGLGPAFPGGRFEFAGNDRVIYIASQETAQALELFESFLGRARPAPGPIR